MAGALDPLAFKDALIVLGAAAIVIPAFTRLKLSPLLGFILVGAVVGPFGLGALSDQAPWLSYITITDAESIAPVADLGVVFLLFMIGLELSFERLVMMRRLVFGLGPLQVAVCAGLIALVGVALGLSVTAAIFIGLALGVSSTALIVQTLANAKKTGGPVGRATFAVLLFQDLAVAPILIAVAIFAGGAAEGGPARVGLALAQSVAGLALIVVAGRLLLRPLFRRVARAKSPELFLAACLLVILGSGLAVASFGVSMAMGALAAGVLLAETEYRRQIEALVEPFKGLLLGVFLIAVGMGINWGEIAADFAAVALGAIGLIAGKTIVTAALARAFGLTWPVALRSALLLAPGSEFSFVILGAATAQGLAPPEASAYALTLAALTMALIPLLFQASERIDLRRSRAVDPDLLPPQDVTAPTVLIAGYGRVGELVARLCEAHSLPYMAIDSDPDVAARARRAGKPVYYGDVAHPELLRGALTAAKALVATMDAPKAVGDVVAAARAMRADLVIVARARDAKDAARLYKLGATDAVPDSVEASLQLAETTLVDVGVPMGHAIASIHDMRAEIRADIQRLAPDAPQPRQVRRRATTPTTDEA
ncbi:MAG: cation:proton antiporter [Caulobacterales bacterium]